MCFCVMGDSIGTCECTLKFSSTHIRAHTYTHACTIGRANSFPDVGAAGSTGNHRNRTKAASVACSSKERLTHFRPHAAGSYLLHAASHASPSNVHPSPADDHGLPSHFLHASFDSHWRQMRAFFMPVRLRVLHQDASVFYSFCFSFPRISFPLRCFPKNAQTRVLTNTPRILSPLRPRSLVSNSAHSRLLGQQHPRIR
jgi:hypothetical protein